MEISVNLVQTLIREQFPQWGNLPIRPVAKSGHDNRTFHLGEEMAVRLPSGEAYAAQAEKEIRWLPLLAGNISAPITRPIAKGEPSAAFPYCWSVNQYLEGETAGPENVPDLEAFARELAAFLRELQAVNIKGAPGPGKHNFYRGAHIQVYDQEVQQAISQLEEVLPGEELRQIWLQAKSSLWTGADVWIHGDIAPGNLLVQDGTLSGVIDFGMMGIGDPSCDYAIGWTFFNGESRRILLEGLDSGTIRRARGWALWKALITYCDPKEEIRENARHTVLSIQEEYDRELAASFGTF